MLFCDVRHCRLASFINMQFYFFIVFFNNKYNHFVKCFCACLQEQLTTPKFLYKMYCHRHNFTMKGGKHHCYSAAMDSITTFTRGTITLTVHLIGACITCSAYSHSISCSATGVFLILYLPDLSTF